MHPVVDEPGVALVDVVLAPHHLQQRGQAHLATWRPPRRRAPVRRTPTDTDRRPCGRGWPAISSGLAIGTPGTYQFADGSSSTAPPAAHSTIWRPASCRSRSPCRPGSCPSPRRRILQPPSTHATRAPLQTPLQLQTCASSASSATPTSSDGDRRGRTAAPARSSGSGSPRSNACIRNATFVVSPSSVAPISLLVADDHASCRRRGAARRTRCARRCPAPGPAAPIEATSTPATLSLVAVREPWYAASGSVPVSVVGEHPGLLPQRRDQAVDLAAVLDALADRVDVRRRPWCASGRRPRSPARR